MRAPEGTSWGPPWLPHYSILTPRAISLSSRTSVWGPPHQLLWRPAAQRVAAGGVTTDPPLGRCPCREPPETLSLLLANRHGRFEIAGFHYEN